jgi:hypothetical protein
MEETRKIKPGLVKKIFVILLICASLMFFAYIFDKYDGSKTTGDGEGAGFWAGIGKRQLANNTDVQLTEDEEKVGFWRSIGKKLFAKNASAQTASGPTCSDGILNQGEKDVDCGGKICGACPTCDDNILNQGERLVDCGGPCNACPPDCTDGILNQDEEKVDCGGKCTACPTCDDNILNQGERHVDCGGPCSACPPDCSDGILNQDETNVDCGGKICAACPSCTDKIQNQGERHVDCGGPCNACPPDCSDGIQNQGETGIDCGGPCNACVQSPQRPVITSAQKDLISQTILASAFVKDLPSDGIIALRFYDFFLGERIWHPDILIGKTGILSSGTPDLVLIMHARYISQLNGGNLCEVIQAANAAGEMWTESEYSDLKLMSKYSGMLKYRDCFGF